MPDLSFSTFLEFVARVEQAAKVGDDIAAHEKRLESLRQEDADLTSKVTKSALEVDLANAAAKAAVADGERQKAALIKDGQTQADSIKATARTEAGTIVGNAQKQAAELKTNLADGEAHLKSTNNAIATAEARLADTNTKIKALTDLLGSAAPRAA